MRRKGKDRKKKKNKKESKKEVGVRGEKKGNFGKSNKEIIK